MDIIIGPTIEAIYDIYQMENCKVNGIEGVPTANKLVMNPGYMDLEFDALYNAIPACAHMEYLPEFSFETAKATYMVPPYHGYFDGNIIVGSDQEQHFDLRFNKLTQTTINPQGNYYWRFVYPIDSSEWALKIKALPYKDEFGACHFYNLISTELAGHQMKVFAINANNDHWMVIETTESISYEEMDKRVMALTMALGLVLGRRYGDYCFHVASEELTFSQITGVEVLSLRETKSCPFKILNPNKNLLVEWLCQHDYQKYALEEMESNPGEGIKWYFEEDATVTIDAVSKLAQLCYQSNDMVLATSMLIDGSLMNIEYQEPFFHVTLETITSILLKDDNIALPPPMPQERYKKEVEPVLIEALVSIQNLSEAAQQIYTKRIKHSLNAASNANKLDACFQKYGYTLTEADKEAIKKRNFTLHGHLTSEKKPLREQQHELLAVSLRLHKLCSILLLKEAGFSGKVLNNEVLFGIKEACERKEHVYIEV